MEDIASKKMTDDPVIISEQLHSPQNIKNEHDRFVEELDSLISEMIADCATKAPAVNTNKDDTSPSCKTYLCPVSDCVYTCPTMSPHIAALHLQSSHSLNSHETTLKFIVL